MLVVLSRGPVIILYRHQISSIGTVYGLYCVAGSCCTATVIAMCRSGTAVVCALWVMSINYIGNIATHPYIYIHIYIEAS